MHELGITQGIIDRAREAAVANGARKVAGLYVVMTPAADFTQDSIEMYFEMLSERGRASSRAPRCTSSTGRSPRPA